MSRGGSKLLTGLISFLLGFLFAVLVEVGAVFGVYWFVMNKDINTIMSAVGLPNTDDRYINTDKENGGVTTLKELLSGVQGLVFENGELAIVGKSFDDISHLIPATDILLEKFYGIADDYIELDHEAFESNPLMNLAQVLSDSVMNIKTAVLLEKLNMDVIVGDDANLLVKSLVAGSECDYATVTYADGRESTLKLPVMYDYYMLQDGNYARVDYEGFERSVDGKSAIPENLKGREDVLLSLSGTIKDEEGTKEFERYALYYVPCRVTAEGVTEAEYIVGEHTAERDGVTYKFQILQYGADTDFIAVRRGNDGKYEINYDEVYQTLDSSDEDYSLRFEGHSYYVPYAANYYFTEYSEKLLKPVLKTVSGKSFFRNGENKMVQLDALTLSDIVADPFAPLDAVLVADVIEGESQIDKIFGTTTLGALLRGEGIDEIINDLEVSTFVEKIAPSNKIMCYIAYRISDLKDNGNNTYTAVYNKGEADEKQVTVTLDADGYIVDVIDDKGVMEGVKVKDVAALANSMPITVLMDVRVDEPIIVYLGYGVKDLTESAGEDYSYTGTVSVDGADKTCYISTVTSGTGENAVEKVDSVWYLDERGEKVAVGGTKVNEVGNRVNSFADDLTVGDVLGVDGTETPLLNAIRDTRLSKMADRIEQLKVSEVIDPDAIEDSAILRQLQNKKVTELSTAIDDLYIQMVYAEEVYGVGKNAEPEIATEFNESWLYYIKNDEAFLLANTAENPPADDTAYDDALGHITQEQFNSGTYYTYGEAKGMWRLVLYKNGAEKAYTMNNFNNMVAACADTVNNATLGELRKAGVVNATEEQLAKKMQISASGVTLYVNAEGGLTSNESEAVSLGEMKLADLVNVVVTHLAK